MTSVHDFSAEMLTGGTQALAEYRGRPMLIVNTATECRFTPQNAGLPALHEAYGGRGLAVLCFPCNQFGKQEPGGSEEIAGFCATNYGVGFPMFAKVEVNGSDAHPLFEHLKAEAPGLLGTRRIKWNFTKFLVDREGRVRERFAPSTKPESLGSKIEALL